MKYIHRIVEGAIVPPGISIMTGTYEWGIGVMVPSRLIILRRWCVWNSRNHKWFVWFHHRSW